MKRFRKRTFTSMAKKYPRVLDEFKTIDAILAGNSIARWGDGEWRCSTGGGCTSQRPDPELAKELQAAIKPFTGYVVGIPKVEDCPRAESWARYCEPQFTGQLNDSAEYFSSFITRPDNAPSIDTPEYWESVRNIWRGRDVVLVVGDKKSITSEMIGTECTNFVEVWGPRQHAYAEIDRIEADIIKEVASFGETARPVRIIMCLGVTATVLAWRLAKKGYNAVDLGHVGMFMRHAGAYRYGEDDVTTPAYRQQLRALHAKGRWGADGGKHTAKVRELYRIYQPKTTLDYGCGENKLAESLAKEFRISGYDPGIAARASMPKPCEMVICTDVLEHVEPSKLDHVLDHIYRLTGKVAYFVIALRDAKSILPDGRNAHLIVQPHEWWLNKLRNVGFHVAVEGLKEGKEVQVLGLKL